MHRYVESFENIQKMLIDFLRHGIDFNKLDPVDQVIESSEIDQVKILNSYRSLKEQRTLFGAMRNINNIVGVMKEKIKIACETHENPTTLELSLEMIKHLSNLAPYIDEFMTNGKKEEIDRINELSRILYRKANYLGFYQDIETQFKEANISKEEVKDFVEKLNEDIELVVGTEDEPLQ